MANDWVQLLELLNKFWDLGSLEILQMRRNCCVKFVFGGLTVLVARSGDQVSFNTTVGDQTLNYQLIGLEDPQVSHLH
jgi:hypothetical protein